MRKFLLSIFALMLAVFSVQAEEKNGTITFKTSGSDSSTAATVGNFVTGQVKENGGFTLTCTATRYCYTGKSGLKMSSKSNNGTLFNLAMSYASLFGIKKEILKKANTLSEAKQLVEEIFNKK